MIEAAQKVVTSVTSAGDIWQPFRSEQPREEVILKIQHSTGRALELKARRVIGSDGERRLDVFGMPIVTEGEREEALGLIQQGLVQILPLEARSVTLNLNGADGLTAELVSRFRAASRTPQSEIKASEISLTTGGRLSITPNREASK